MGCLLESGIDMLGQEVCFPQDMKALATQTPGRTSVSLSNTANSSPATGTEFKPIICTAMEGPASVIWPLLSVNDRT